MPPADPPVRITALILRRTIGVLASLALMLGLTVALSEPASAGVWDRVAKCESGGRWKINTGNGYYGGLQFSRRTWNGHGGKKYGRTANKASKREQIAIARRVLATQGPGAWGGCARKAHLTKSSGNASRHAKPSGSHSSDGKHKVVKVRAKKGDTIAEVAKRHHVSWKKVYRLNKHKLKKAKIGKHPHREFRKAMKLRIRR